MQNHYISNQSLPSLSQLLQRKISLINPSINKLKLKDVEDDKVFQSTKNSIKSTILLQPIMLGNPKFIDHEYEEKVVQVAYGYSKINNYIHEISFPYTGDENLFLHTSDGQTWYSSDHGVIKPNFNSITVYIELTEPNPEKAKTEASNLLRLTKDIAERNSAAIKSWNISVEKRIDEDLEIKRNELIRLLGNN